MHSNPHATDGIPGSVTVDLDINETLTEVKVVEDAEPIHKVVYGRWIPTRTGTLVAVQQWRIFEGNFKFYCGGRILRGPGNPYWWLILIVHFSASAICCIWFDILPVYPSFSSKTLLLAITALSTLLTIISLIQVACSDPGIVVRPDIEQRIVNLIEYLADKSPNSEVTLPVNINGKEVRCHFCDICCQYCLPQVEHCIKCDSCIERFDHHNEIFGICIGRRNIGAFIWFLILSLLNFQIIQTIACINIAARVTSDGWRMSSFFASPTLYVLMLSMLHPPYGPLKFSWILLKQLYNLMLNRTTYEACQCLSIIKKDDKMSAGCTKKLNALCSNFKTFVLCPDRSKQFYPRRITKTKAVRKELKRLKMRLLPSRVHPLVPTEACEAKRSLPFTPTEGRKSRLRHTLLRRSRVNMLSPNFIDDGDESMGVNAAIQEPATASGFHRLTVLRPPPLFLRGLMPFNTKDNQNKMKWTKNKKKKKEKD